MLFHSWEGVIRTIVIGILAYTALLIILRTSGKRTLSKMNAFDFVVTVALGSTLATILLSQDVALAEGVAAFVTLVGMQYVITWLSVRSSTIQQFVKSSPSLLFYKGEFFTDTLKSQRVTQEEIYAAIRGQGIASIDDVGAVILETDGSFSTLQCTEGNLTSLKGVVKPASIQEGVHS